MPNGSAVTTVVFDVGNVLLAWDPRHLYRKLFDDPSEMDVFLATICTPAWNVEQDRGRSWGEAIAAATAAHPHEAARIAAYSERWQEMVPHRIEGSVAALKLLSDAGIPLYALTNFSSDKFRQSVDRWPFFSRFDGWVVSGDEGVIKPDAEIYRRLTARYNLEPGECLYIDDSKANIETAQDLGFAVHHFEPTDAGVAALYQMLFAHQLPVPSTAPVVMPLATATNAT